MKKILFIILMAFSCGTSANLFADGNLECGRLLVSCGYAMGCTWDDWSLDEYAEYIKDVDKVVCPDVEE